MITSTNSDQPQESGAGWGVQRYGDDPNVGGHLTLNGDRLTIGGKRIWFGPRPAAYEAVEQFRDQIQKFDSAAWTGIEKRLATAPEVVEQLAAAFAEIDKIVEASGLTNSEKQKAKTIATSLRTLIASPEPEWKAIVVLLSSPALGAIIALLELIKFAFELIFGS